MKIKYFYLVPFLLVSLFFLKSEAFGAYGTVSEGDHNSPGTPPTCNDAKPGTPTIYFIQTIGSDKVKIAWDKSDNANNFTIAYGPGPGQYVWGLDRFGTNATRDITINHLPRGTYYFVVRGNHGCMPGQFSNEKSATVGGGSGGTTTASYVPSYTAPKTLVTTVPIPTTPPSGGFRVIPTTTQQVPSVSQEVPTVAPFAIPTPTPEVGFFQKIINMILGK